MLNAIIYNVNILNDDPWFHHLIKSDNKTFYFKTTPFSLNNQNF